MNLSDEPTNLAGDITRDSWRVLGEDQEVENSMVYDQQLRAYELVQFRTATGTNKFTYVIWPEVTLC